MSGGLGRRWRDLADGQKKAADFFRSGQLIHLPEDLFLHELELMKPYRRGNQHIKHSPFNRVRQGPGRDLRSYGSPPEVDEVPIHRLERDIPLLEDLLKDIPDHFRF